MPRGNVVDDDDNNNNNNNNNHNNNNNDNNNNNNNNSRVRDTSASTSSAWPAQRRDQGRNSAVSGHNVIRINGVDVPIGSGSYSVNVGRNGVVNVDSFSSGGNNVFQINGNGVGGSIHVSSMAGSGSSMSISSTGNIRVGNGVVSMNARGGSMQVGNGGVNMYGRGGSMHVGNGIVSMNGGGGSMYVGNGVVSMSSSGGSMHVGNGVVHINGSGGGNATVNVNGSGAGNAAVNVNGSGGGRSVGAGGRSVGGSDTTVQMLCTYYPAEGGEPLDVFREQQMPDIFDLSPEEFNARILELRGALHKLRKIFVCLFRFK